MKFWNRHDLITERNRFIAARKDHVSWTGLCAVFFVTVVATWLASTALFYWTEIRMPWRYMLAMLLGYATFFLAIRVWSDFQKPLPLYRPKGDDLGAHDAMLVPDGQGYIFSLILLLPFALILGGLMSWFGASMLLEVAFEVAFAGVVVRSAWTSPTHVGNWAAVLLRKTVGVVLLMIALTCSAAYYLQLRDPTIQTATDVLRYIFL